MSFRRPEAVRVNALASPHTVKWLRVFCLALLVSALSCGHETASPDLEETSQEILGTVAQMNPSTPSVGAVGRQADGSFYLFGLNASNRRVQHSKQASEGSSTWGTAVQTGSTAFSATSMPVVGKCSMVGSTFSREAMTERFLIAWKTRQEEGSVPGPA